MLAETGLLTNRRATTHWMYAERLAHRYPDVLVDPDPIYIRDGNIATSGGVTSARRAFGRSESTVKRAMRRTRRHPR